MIKHTARKFLRERVGPPRVDAGAADGSELVVGEGVAEVALVRVVEHPRHLVPAVVNNNSCQI